MHIPLIPPSIHIGLSMFTTPLSKENGDSAFGFVMSSNLYLVGAYATIDHKVYFFKEVEVRVIVFAINNILDCFAISIESY